MSEQRADDELFAQAMRGVDRLEQDERPETVRRRPRKQRVRADLGAPVRFSIERFGERVTGLGPGVGRRSLLRLQRGEVPIDLVVDLHGHNAESGRDLVLDVLATALAKGQRCLLLVHGRGLHSEGWPVLKEHLPGWLAERPHGPRVLAFSTAGPDLGGTGATLVLLRKPRRRKP